MVQLLCLGGPVALPWWSSCSSLVAQSLLLVAQLLFLDGPVAFP